MTFVEAFNPIRALRSTFETMNLQPGHLWGGGILLIFIEQMAGVGVQFIEPVTQTFGKEALAMFLFGSCVAALIAFSLATWMMPGLYLTMRSVLQTGEPTEGGLFDHQGKFVPLLLTRLLVGVCSLVLCIPGAILMVVFIFAAGELPGALAFIVSIGGVLVGEAIILFCVVGVMLAESALIFEDLSPTEALKRSWGMADGNRWRLVLFFFVNTIFAVLGLILCCVGVIATGAVARLATAEAYLQVTTGDQASSSAELSD